MANDRRRFRSVPISRALGTLTLRRLWSQYDLALDYVGGVAYYSPKSWAETTAQMDFDQKITGSAANYRCATVSAICRKETLAEPTVRWARREYVAGEHRLWSLSGAAPRWERWDWLRAS